MARRQVDQLNSPASEEGVDVDEKRVGSLMHKSGKRQTDLAAGAGGQDQNFQPVLEALAECAKTVRIASRRLTIEKSHHRHCRLLRPHRQWPRCRRAAEQRDELSTLSFDHLVGAGEEGRRHVNSDRLRRLGVDDQFEFGRLLNWQVGRFCAFQYLVHIVDDAAHHIVDVWPVGEKSTCARPSSPASGQRKPISRRKVHNSRDVQHRVPRRHDIECVAARIGDGAERSIEIAGTAHFHQLKSHVETLRRALSFAQLVVGMIRIPYERSVFYPRHRLLEKLQALRREYRPAGA